MDYCGSSGVNSLLASWSSIRIYMEDLCFSKLFSTGCKELTGLYISQG